ncbi:MAG: tail fiber domain-containing protein [Chitinophagales bacterium]|nr:tail fiber domain-containing protein [Chitinophagales bacterium]
MKNCFTRQLFLFFLTFAIAKLSVAQAPPLMSYQAVIRNSANQLVTNQNVGMRVSILQGSPTGSAVYVETHSGTTNANGLLTVTIGSGTVVSGSFSGINWASGPYFLKTETDPNGGTNYTITGTQELMSVPYALYAAQAGNAVNYNAGSGITISSGTISAVDNSATNEIQTLSLSGTNLSISGSGGNSVDLAPLLDNTWKTTGNSGTNPATHFIGTTDNQPLNFKANNQKAGRIGLAGDGSTFFGYQAGNSDNGSDNLCTYIGYQAGLNSTNAYDNVGIGYQSLHSNTTGYSNTAIGTKALYYNTTGYENVACGAGALLNNIGGPYNTAIGRGAGIGYPGVNFLQCTFVGSFSSLTVYRANVTMLGYGIDNAQCTGDNQVLLGNTAISQIRAQVTSITGYSDARIKNNVKEDVVGLDFITRLRPVSYNQNPEILHQIWGTPESLRKTIDHSDIKRQRFVGLIAQEVEQAMKESGYTHFPGIDIPRNEKEVYSLRYGDFIVPLIKSVQELNMKNELLEKKNETLQNENAELKAIMLDMQSRLAKLESLLSLSRVGSTK